MNWEEFDKEIDVETDAEATSYEEVPEGEYEVEIRSLEQIVSKTSHRPMLRCGMKIIAGKYKNSYLWMNKVLDHPFSRKKASDFLRSLVSQTDTPMEIHFKTYSQYNDLIMDVAEAIKDKFEYAVSYKEHNGYPEYTIEDVFVCQDDFL